MLQNIEADHEVADVGVPPMMDTLTILRHQSNLLAKTWRADGTVAAYDQAKFFTQSSVPLAGIADLSAQLTQLQDDPHACVIRGVYLGDDHAMEMGLAPQGGRVRRLLELFDDTPHHWVLVEVDDFEPLTADPVRDPVPAIDEYIAACLCASRGRRITGSCQTARGTPPKAAC